MNGHKFFRVGLHRLRETNASRCISKIRVRNKRMFEGGSRAGVVAKLVGQHDAGEMIKPGNRFGAAGSAGGM